MPLRATDFTRASAIHHKTLFPDANQHAIETGLGLLRIATAFQQASERVVHRPLGLRWTGFSTVFALSIFGELDASTLAQLAGVSRQAMSLVVTNLERDGFIARHRGRDRRTNVVELTEDGRLVADKALRGQVAMSEQWFSDLTDDELALLTSLFARIAESRSVEK